MLKSCFDTNKSGLIILSNSNEINTKFSVVRVNEVTLVFYILPKAGKKALVYQILSPAEKGPVIVDYVSGDDFYITKSEDNIKAFYKNENGLLGYLEFIWNKKEWENFVPLYETDKKINGICAFEKDEKIYIVFLEKTLEKYRLIFIEYTLGKIKTKKLFLNCFFDSDPSVYSYNNKIYISFRIGIRALFCYLDSSFILSSPNYMFPAFYKKQECVRLSTNIDLGTSGVFGDYFYAMIDDEENIELGVINHILKKIMDT